MSNQNFDTESLLHVEIRPNELSILLERLAATEAMFGEPASTIRDVAELTEASPNAIARILGEIRGVKDFNSIGRRLEDHELRLSQLERFKEKAQVTPPPFIRQTTSKRTLNADNTDWYTTPKPTLHADAAKWQAYRLSLEGLDTELTPEQQQRRQVATIIIAISVALAMLIMFSGMSDSARHVSPPPIQFQRSISQEGSP